MLSSFWGRHELHAEVPEASIASSPARAQDAFGRGLCRRLARRSSTCRRRSTTFPMVKSLVAQKFGKPARKQEWWKSLIRTTAVSDYALLGVPNVESLISRESVASDPKWAVSRLLTDRSNQQVFSAWVFSKILQVVQSQIRLAQVGPTKVVPHPTKLAGRAWGLAELGSLPSKPQSDHTFSVGVHDRRHPGSIAKMIQPEVIERGQRR